MGDQCLLISLTSGYGYKRSFTNAILNKQLNALKIIVVNSFKRSAMPQKLFNPAIDEDNFIDINDSRDIDFWMLSLGLSTKTLVKAVGIVGPDAREVRKWMKKNNPKKKPPISKRIRTFLSQTFRIKPAHPVSHQS